MVNLPTAPPWGLGPAPDVPRPAPSVHGARAGASGSSRPLSCTTRPPGETRAARWHEVLCWRLGGPCADQRSPDPRARQSSGGGPRPCTTTGTCVQTRTKSAAEAPPALHKGPATPTGSGRGSAPPRRAPLHRAPPLRAPPPSLKPAVADQGGRSEGPSAKTRFLLGNHVLRAVPWGLPAWPWDGSVGSASGM